MDALLELEEREGRVNSAAVSVDLGEMLVEIDLAVDADDLDDGQRIVDDAIRRAVAMAGGTVLTTAHSQVVERSAELISA